MRDAATRRGLTLVELLVVVAVLAILLVLAAPSMQDFILIQRLRGIHAQLVTDLQLARSEAMSSGLVVNFRVQTSSALPGSMSCYVLFNDTPRNYAVNGASSQCDCTQTEGNRCTQAGTREIRTVQIPTTRGVTLALPLFQTQAVAFDPSTGGMVLLRSEAGVVSGSAFTVISAIDTARSLSAVVGLSGRPTVCKPTGSTLSEPSC
jgi:type IV fimbrial biogenesis protein FimT